MNNQRLFSTHSNIQCEDSEKFEQLTNLTKEFLNSLVAVVGNTPANISVNVSSQDGNLTAYQ